MEHKIKSVLHPVDVRANKEIQKLISIHGWTGYGLYWAIVETIELTGKIIEYKIQSEKLEHNYNKMVEILDVDVEIIRSIIEDFDLFWFDDVVIGNY